MILGGDDPPAPPIDFIEWEKQQAAAKRAAAGPFDSILGDLKSKLPQIPDVPPLARALGPLAVVFLLDRKQHPILWWGLGMGPLVWAAKGAIMEQRLIGPPAPPPASPIRKW